MRRSRRGSRVPATAIALLIIGAIVAVSFVAFNNGPPFVHGYRVSAMMLNTNSLRPGAPVRIAGVNVGKVTKISAGEGNTARVFMDLRKTALPLHRDATIRVRPRLFIEGGYYVALSPGSPSAPVLHDKGVIPLAQTRSAVQAYEIVSDFDAPTREGLRQLLKTTDTALGHGGVRGLRQGIAPLAPTLRDAALVTQALRGRQPGDVTGTIRGSDRLARALAADPVALSDLVTNLNVTAAALASQDGALGEGVRQLDALFGEAPTALTALDGSLGPLRRFARALDPGLVAAPPLVQRITTAVRQFGALVEPVERGRIISAFQATLVDFPTLLRRLTDVLNVVKPVTDCVGTHIAPVLRQTIDDGPLSTHDPVWQDLAHLLPGLAGQAQTFDANGYAVRYEAAANTQSVGVGPLPGLAILNTLLSGSGGANGGRSPIAGSSPHWVGRLKGSDFQPGAACADQPVPNLSAPSGGGR